MASKNPETPVEEAIQLSRSILMDFDKGTSVGSIARKCERLGQLLDDTYLLAYIDQCRNWSPSDFRAAMKEATRSRSEARIQAMMDCMSDFRLNRNSASPQKFLQRNLLDAETLIVNNRKNAAATYGRPLGRLLDETQAVLDRVATRLHQHASKRYIELRFGNIPESIFAATRARVDVALGVKCPSAIGSFALAYEELAKDKPENWTNAALAVRRVLADLADAVFPPREEKAENHSLGTAEYINRLWEYCKLSIASNSQQATFGAELADIGKRIDAIYSQSNKGVHAVVTRAEADRIVIRAYLLIADILAL